MTVKSTELGLLRGRWPCGERVRYPTIFPKSLIRYLMTEAGIVANRGSIEIPGSLIAPCDYCPRRKHDEGRGRRLALATTTLMSPPLHRRHALRRISRPFKGLSFAAGRSHKGCLLTAREEGKCRFIYKYPRNRTMSQNYSYFCRESRK